MNTQLTQGNQPLLLGGDSSTQSGYETQIFSFNLEENCWAQLDLPLKPPDRDLWFRVVWDQKNDRVFLFGGRQIIQSPGSAEVQEVQARDLWAFSCKEDRWTELADSITFSGTFPLNLGPSSYDPQTDRLLVLKLKENDGDLCDISACKLPGSSWVDLKSLNPPNFRGTRYVAYDPRAHVLILAVRGESETSGGLKGEIWIYYLDGNIWSYCGDLPGNSWEHLIVPGKPGEAYILTYEMIFDEPPQHYLWHLTLDP